MVQRVFRKEDLIELKSIIQKEYESVFLVRGDKSYLNSGAKDFVDNLFNQKDLVAFSDFKTNPQLDDVKKGVELFQKNKHDIIVAIGGGSALDMAKLISLFAHQESDFLDIVKGTAVIKESKTPLLAIPTTSGTGAEATHFAVVYVDKIKYSVGHSIMLPEIVYLSSEFSFSANKYLTACTGLDAFCQAVESVWSVNANDESLNYAVESIKLTWNNLQDAVNKNDIGAKNNMQEASFLAGKAINITKTTAPHALSYAFTSYYNIPHGHAVALSLPFFIKFNYELNELDCIDERGYKDVQKRIELIAECLELDVREIHISFTDFFSSIGININLQELIKDLNTRIIIDNVNLERLSNNPRKITKENILVFLTNAL